MSESKNVKFLTNIAEIITFKFDQGLEKDGQHGKFYSYGVVWKGEDAYMAVSPMLNDMLQKIGNLKDRTLQVMKYEDPSNTKKTLWKVMDENNNDLTNTPSKAVETTEHIQHPPASTNDATGQMKVLQDEIEKMRTWAVSVNMAIQELKKKVSGLETLSIDLKGKEATEFHTSFPTDVSEVPEGYEDIPTVK